MMSGEALAAALQGARDPSDTAYRELVETLITEVEVEEVQERAWQRQWRSQLRIAELEAREDARGGGTRHSAALGVQSGGGTKSNDWEQSAEDGRGVRSEPNASPSGQSGNRLLSDEWKQSPEHGEKASPIQDETPPSGAKLRATPGTGDEIRVLEAELALSIERERDSVRRLQGYGPLTLGDFPGPSSKSGDGHGKIGRSRPEQSRGEVTETEDSAWETDSGSGSQESMPASEGSAESSGLWTPESAAERPSECQRAAVHLEAPESNWSLRESPSAMPETGIETCEFLAAEEETGWKESALERVGASITVAKAAPVVETRDPHAIEEETGAFEQIKAPTAGTRVVEPRASSDWEVAATTAVGRGLGPTGSETVPHVKLGKGDTSTAGAESLNPQTLTDAASTAVAESLNPQTSTEWEEIAQVKAEQLEEAKLLLAAVMEGERAALETVARLEQEVRDSREAKEGLEREVRDIEEAAERLIQELRSRTEAEKRLKRELEDMREAQLGMERRSAEAAALARKQIEELSARVEEGVGRVWGKGRAGRNSGQSEEDLRLANGNWKGSEGVRPMINGVRIHNRRSCGENGDVSRRNSGARGGVETSSVSSSETESADAQTAGRRGGSEAGFWGRKEPTPSVEQWNGEPGRQEGGTGPSCNPPKFRKESVEEDGLNGEPPSEAGGQSERSRLSGDRSDGSNKGSRGQGEEGSTREELTVRETAYQSRCEELQLQVRSALDQVELLRKQQTEREERAAALYEGRLSAYVKQMVGVKRENEALRAQQQELQSEKAHAQEQLEAEHQKRRDEFHAAQAQLDSFSEGVRQLSERVLQQTSVLRRSRLAFLDVARQNEEESTDGLDNGGTSGGKLEMPDSEVQGPVNCGKDKSAKGVLDSCQAAMARFEGEVKEQLRAMEMAAEMGRGLEERGADLARARGERDAAEELARRLEKDLEKMRVEKEGAEGVARRLEADLGMMREEKEGAEDLVRRLEANLEKAGAEREGASKREGGLRAQVADLERRRGEQLREVANLEEQLLKRESSLEQYKAEIQEELAGLSEHMHLAAAERAREDTDFRDKLEERDRELRTREEMIRTLEKKIRTHEETIWTLEKRIRTLEETGSVLKKRTDTLEEIKGTLEEEVRDLRQQLWKEKELSESVQRRLEASENARHEREVSETGGSCPKCGEREVEWQERSRLEREAFEEVLEEQSRGLAAEVKSVQGLLMRKETRVGELEGTVHDLLDERKELERALKESEAKQRAMGRQLAQKQEEVNGLKEKVVRIDAGWGLDNSDGSEAPWDDVRKERLIAEVQGILEQYSMAGERSARSGRDDASEEVEGSEGPSEEASGEVDGSRKASESAMEDSSERAEAFQEGVSAARGDVSERVGVSERDLAFGGWERVNRGRQRGATGRIGKAKLRPFEVCGLTRESGQLFAQTWAERERRLRTDMQGALSEFEQQEESVRRAYEAEISALKKKVRLLEEGQGASEIVAGNKERVEDREVEQGVTSGTRLGKQTPGLTRERGPSDGQESCSAAPGREVKSVSAEAVLDVREAEAAEAGSVAQTAGLVGQTAGLGEQTAGLVRRSTGSAGCSELSPKDRRSLVSGQSGAWSDKRPDGEERPREGESGVEQAGRLVEKRKEKAVLDNVSEELARVLEENRRVVDENVGLRSEVAELGAVNRELQLRLKVLEDDPSRLLDKIATSHAVPLNPAADTPLEAPALELAALQAKLDEATARAKEQKSCYKHLKGKYLRQLARQQAMHEYMLQEGESPANLSPRSGVAPSVGRPGNNASESGPPSFKSRPTSEAGGQLGGWPESWGDVGPEQRQGLVAQNGDASHGQSDGLREQTPPSRRSSVREFLHINDRGRRSDMERRERAEGRRSDQRQIDGSETTWGRGAPGGGGQWNNRTSLDEIPEKGPSSACGQSEGQTQFQTQVGSRLERTPNTSTSVSVQREAHGKSGSAFTTPYGSRLPSRRQSDANSVQAHSGIPVGLRVLMDGRPLPGFPAKVEDLGGYFAEERAQKDGVLGVKLPSSRASSPFLHRKVERRVSRASSAPPMRPSYNRSARVWV